MTRATQALGAHDLAAWEAALPAEGGDARRAVDALYRHLVRLPWTSVRLVAEPVRGHPGRFYVGAVGEVGGADPADRIMARRVFDVSLRGGRPVLLRRRDAARRARPGDHGVSSARWRCGATGSS